MSVNTVNPSTGELIRVAGGTLYVDAPIGSYLIMKDNSVKPQGYLLSDGKDTTGTDDELSTKYPLLYAYLGNTNILPTEFDHSVLGEPEDISTNLNHTTNSNYYTAPYDGVIIINWTPADRYKSVYWSNDGTVWTEIVYNLDTSTYQTTTVPIKKGDRLYLRDSIADNVIYARFYKQYKYIKAKQVAVPTDIAAGVEDMLTEVTDVIPSEASASNKLVTESEISKTEKTLVIGGSAAAIVKIDVSVPFLDTDYGKFTEIDFQVRSDNIRFFISANDGVYFVTAQHNYRSSGWLVGLYYLVNGSKSISLYVSILNYPANVGAKLVFNGLDGAEIIGISRVDALPSGYASMKQFPIIYASDLTSTATQNSNAPITSGGVYSELNKKAEKEMYWVWDNQTTFTIDLEDISHQRIGNKWTVLFSVLSTVNDSHSPKTHLFSIGIIATASAPVSIISVGGDGGFTASASGWTVTITCPHPYNNAKLFF